MSKKKPRTQRASRVAYHYTAGVYLPDILSSGVIQPATALVEPPERPAVWFSVREEYDPTARKIWSGVPMTFEEQVERVGAARIGVSTRWLRPCKSLRRKARIPDDVWMGLDISARKLGADPRDWWGRVGPVPARMWCSVEQWEDSAWTMLLDVADLRKVA